MRPRTSEEVTAVARALRAFVRAGYPLFPLARGRKSPRDRGWQHVDYSLHDDIGPWVKTGGNVGVRLRDADLVLDLDPRNFTLGDDPFKRLCADARSELFMAPTVITGRGDGGRHIYFQKPAGLRVRGKLEAYAGIDFRSAGAYVVAPGSLHPETGRAYALDEFTPDISHVRPVPEALLAMIAREDNRVRIGNEGVGKITNEQLAVLLTALDPEDFGKGHYDDFIRLSAACHDATAGGGLVEFLSWCAGDNLYADEVAQAQVERHWESFTAGKPGGATYRTLFKAVADAGRPDLVAVLEDPDVGFPNLEIGPDDLPHHDFTNMDEALRAEQHATLAALDDARADIEAEKLATKAALKEMRNE